NTDAAYNYVQRKITVTNYLRPKLNMQLNKLGCGVVEIIPTLDTFNGIPSIITYSILNNLDSIIYSGNIAPSIGRDSVRLDTGAYTIQCRSSFALACDSIVESQVSITEQESYTLPKETEIIACYTSSQLLSVDLKWEKAEWSTGDTTHIISVSTSGIYSVELTDSCGNQYTHNFLVTFRSFESNQPDTTVCFGTLVKFTIKSATNISWTWPDLNTGQDYATSDSGEHILTLYDSVCNYTFNDTFELFNIYKPVVDIPISNLVLCKDSIQQVFANYNAGYTYSWTNGSDSNSSILTSTSQKHYVTASNTCGTDIDSITVTQKLPPSIDVGGDYIICRGDSIVLSYINNPEYTYSWNTGETGTSIKAKEEKFYILTATNSCGIVNDSSYLFVLDTPTVYLGPDTAIIEFDIVNVKNRTPSRFASYLWSFGSNADNADLKLEGTYWLEETNVCGSDRDSIVITFKPVGLDAIEQLGFKVYPNPTTEYIQIENSSGKPAHLTLRTIVGKEVKAIPLFGRTTKVDLDDLSTGKYIVEITQEAKKVNTIIVIQ
ncbi:MAG: T9SS type A sorting domain-containing protein, partial [Bacteroidia bacterium]|nr:T9SS type A sorting domain-containing protein [Bacteroidia bacterium]